MVKVEVVKVEIVKVEVVKVEVVKVEVVKVEVVKVEVVRLVWPCYKCPSKAQQLVHLVMLHVFKMTIVFKHALNTSDTGKTGPFLTIRLSDWTKK